MTKTQRILMFLAIVPTVLAACGKDPAATADPGTVYPELLADCLIVDNTSFDFTKTTTLGEDGYYHIGVSPAGSGETFLINLKIDKDDIDRRYTLSDTTSGAYAISVIWDEARTFSFEALDGHVNSILGSDINEDASAVASGTLLAELNEENFITETDILLANGHRFHLSTVTPVDDILFTPYCGVGQ